MPYKTNKTAIFDLDGTLLDSLKGIGDAANLLLEENGYPVHPMDSYRYFVGDGVKELVRRALPSDWSGQFHAGEEKKKEAVLMRLILRYREIYDQLWPTDTRPYSGIPELLDELSGHGVMMAVLSNKADNCTRRMVKELLGQWSFRPVFGQRVHVPKKPDPAAALEAAEILDTPPDRVVFIGDTAVDMQTAVNAGMYPVGVLWGFRDAEELNANGAKTLVRHPMELANLILNQ
jgi:phosphoglycolate phosphatase